MCRVCLPLLNLCGCHLPVHAADITDLKTRHNLNIVATSNSCELQRSEAMCMPAMR